MPMGRKPALDAVDVKVRKSAGDIIGYSYLRNAKLQPIDVMYKQALYSNTPRIGVQNPSLPDLRMKRQSGGEHARSAVHHGKSEVGDATPMEGGAMDIKKALKIWNTIHSQMSADEKKHVEKANKAISMIKKVIDTLDSDKIKKIKKSKTIKWLMGLAKKQFGSGGECMCGEGFWADLKKKALKVGKAVSKGVKGVAKGVKGVAKTVGKVATVGAEIAMVIPGLEELSPVLAEVAVASKGVEKLAKGAQKASRKGQQETRKELQKIRGGMLSLPSTSGVVPGIRSNDRLSFVATHPLNYRKAIL
jgi:hypothetical protein